MKTFEVNKDVLIEGQKLAAGKYALFSTQDGGAWTVFDCKQTSATKKKSQLPNKRCQMKKFTLVLSACLLANNIGNTQTGIPVPEMAVCDSQIIGFMNTYKIPGATIAISKDGKLKYMRAFGNANIAGTEQVQPYHMFRIASSSKPITAIAIMKLVETGLVKLSDKVFGPNGILKIIPISMEPISPITGFTILPYKIYWNTLPVGIGISIVPRILPRPIPIGYPVAILSLSHCM